MSSSLAHLLKTTPHDKKHFPATNQIHYCWQKYNEYVLCVKQNEGDENPCFKAKKLAASICVEEQFNQWQEQRANGNFLGVQEKVAEKHDHH